MKSLGLVAVLAAVLMAAPAIYAQQASAPTGSTGQCKDGSYSSQASKRGACKGHQGVKEWYTASSASTASKASTATTSPAVAPAAAAAAAAPTTTSAATSAASAKKAASAPSATPAAGGGPGKVWVNSGTKVYHCPGDKYYGTTKKGSYMTEADAKAAHNRPAAGKTCSP